MSERLKEILPNITQGNWFVMHDNDINVESPAGSGEIDTIGYIHNVYDAQLVAMAPEMARLVLSLQSERDRYRTALESISRGLFSTRNAQSVAQTALREET